VNELMIWFIVIAIAANIVLAFVAIVGPRLRRRGSRSPGASNAATMAPAVSSMTPALAATGSVSLSAAADHGTDATSVTAFASAGDLETGMRDQPDDGARPRRFVMPPEDDYPTTDAVQAFLTGPRPQPPFEERYDEATGLPTEAAWDEAIRHEDARFARYGRPATIIVAELDRLDALAARIGRDNADRLIPPVAAVLRRQGRQSDIIARIGRARFQVLLTETDEVAAINYIERVRQACDIWLEAAAISVRLVMGWASPAAGGSLLGALRVADQRMHADRARGSMTRSPASGGATSPPSPTESSSMTEPVAPLTQEPDPALPTE
jgi:diguanylate cyclase (GGDEF)-like protein